ncbi:hypothetical protein [Streptomyces sp. NRRL S-920]|uniref:hypothetical protein n=1 Tax=Streptomyces sp. NRRL S-920 TaxID=1463921 RepID=UPI00131B4C6C|nr:hypothetical protein [Streptomyces sp. NRRL S-920]
MDQEMRLPLLTLDEAHDVIDVLARGAATGDVEAERLLCELAARVPSRDVTHTGDGACTAW